MCLIAFAYQSHPKYRLILAANRDEFYGRPTRKAQFWHEEGFPDILAGKDEEAGGTWMGVSKSRRWAALTNYRDPNWKLENPPSRGELVLNFLKSNLSAKEYLKQVEEHGSQYVGFNILIGDSTHLFHYSNYDRSPVEIKPGIHGVSNALLDTPWPKLDHAKSALSDNVQSVEPDKQALFTFLTDGTMAADEDLPKTGIPYEWEKAISSMFIKTDRYGTRCSSVLFIDHEGNIDFTERRFKPGTDEILDENTYSVPV